MNYSEAAKRLKESKSTSTFHPCMSEDDVKKKAVASVKAKGGDVSKDLHVLGEYELQFGLFKGKTFKWLAENGLGYAAWLVDSMGSETATTAPLSKNKHAFKKYLNSFPEGKSVVALKARERMKKTSTSSSQSKFY